MIQRIQSIWLFLAALFSTAMFMFNVLNITYIVDGETVDKGVKLLESNYFLPILVIAMVLLPSATIFFFKKHKRQINFALLAILVNIAFIGVYIMYVNTFVDGHTPAIESHSYGLASFFPVASIIFLILAIAGIRKDKKLLRSLDRLR